MFSILKLSSLLTAETGVKVHPLSFPHKTLSTECTVELNGGGSVIGNVGSVNMQVMVKSDHPGNAEKTALLFLSKYNDRTDIAIDNVQVIQCKANQTAPFYLGVEDGFYLFSINFNLILGF